MATTVYTREGKKTFNTDAEYNAFMNAERVRKGSQPGYGGEALARSVNKAPDYQSDMAKSEAEAAGALKRKYELQKQGVEGAGAQERADLARQTAEQQAELGFEKGSGQTEGAQRTADVQQRLRQAGQLGQIQGAQLTAEQAQTESKLGRQYQTSERMGAQEYGSTEASKARAFTAAENAIGRTFTSSEREAVQAFANNQRLGAEAFTATQNQLGREFTTEERKAIEAYTTSERESSQTYQTSERMGNEAFNTFMANLQDTLATGRLDHQNMIDQNNNLTKVVATSFYDIGASGGTPTAAQQAQMDSNPIYAAAFESGKAGKSKEEFDANVKEESDYKNALIAMIGDEDLPMNTLRAALDDIYKNNGANLTTILGANKPATVPVAPNLTNPLKSSYWKDLWNRYKFWK